MKELLEYITQNITGNNNIKVIEEETEGVKLYRIIAPQEIMGLLIGKQGKVIKAIRTLGKTRAMVDGTRVSIQLEEDGASQASQ